MSSPLEKFVQQHKDQFDSELPDPRIWDKISEMVHPNSVAPPVRSMKIRWWTTAAAAIVLMAGMLTFYFSDHQKKNNAIASGAKTVQKDPDNRTQPSANNADTLMEAENKMNSTPQVTKQNNTEPVTESGGEENKEMYYYTKLIELKHEELKTLEKDEPLLYKQFAGDVQKLDSVYHSLKMQLPDHSNREQVIEAMISNLQLQIGLLNRQLKIIKQIKRSKKSAYEKAYQSV